MASMALAVGVPLTTISTDPYTNTSSFHQTQVEPDTYSFGSTIVSVFQSGRFSDGGASNIGYATTTNNGTSWTHGFLPGTTIYATPAGTWARISDPSISYDAKHNVWIAVSLAIDNSVTGKAVLASISTDGGLTFGNPVTVSLGGGGSFYDKEWIGCDNTAASPNYGNCYVEWDDAAAGNILKMSRSTNGGTTWTASSVPSSSVIGGQPLALPNGNVVVPIANAFGSNLETFISTNGGSSYTGPNTIASVSAAGPPTNFRDGEGLPSAEVDAGGTIYVAWSDCRFRSSCNANDIVFSTSTNGTSWSAVKRVPFVGTGAVASFFIPGMGADHATAGHITVASYVFLNNNCGPSTCKLAVAAMSSTNGGSTWGPLIKVAGIITLTGLPLTNQGYMVGDYISTSFGSNGKAYPVFANATGTNCTLGQITSCHEFMVSPTNGLQVTGGTRRATTGPVLFRGSGAGAVRARTAF
jgi:hypothetical protein